MAIHDQVRKSSVRRVLDIIGDRWTLLIILSAFGGMDRFDQWKQALRVSPGILSSRLKRLMAAGLMRQEPVSPESRRSRYALTPKALELFDWALTVRAWESTWIYSERDHPVSVRHISCASEAVPQLVCAHCRKPIFNHDVYAETGPGYDAIRTKPRAGSRRSTQQTDIDGDPEFIGHIVDIIGDRWSYLVLAAAFLGARRFDDFQNQLDIATNVLSDRLRRLVSNGLLARSRYRDRPARYEYILTEKSIGMFNVPLTLALWGDKWLSDPDSPAFLRWHTPCGRPLKVISACSMCADAMTPENTELLN